MTEAQAAQWGQVYGDYRRALAIARKCWPADTPPDVIQSAAATILIRHEKVGGLHAATGNGNGGAPAQRQTAAAPPAAGGAIACPKCGGEMWDNRNDKKTPGSPDYRCKDKSCVDESGRVTGHWIHRKKGSGKAAASRAPARATAGASARPGAPQESFDDFPEALDQEDDDLPF